MEQGQSTKLAGNIVEGDRILWDGKPATVTHKQNYRVAMLAGVQTELMVKGDGFVASNVCNAGDSIIMA